jgi:acyl transferase domain-containing protein/acyl carrier protein
MMDYRMERRKILKLIENREIAAEEGFRRINDLLRPTPDASGFNAQLLYYRSEWVEAAAPDPGPSDRKFPGTVLLLAEDDRLRQLLEEQIAGCGGPDSRVVTVKPGRKYQGGANREYRVRPGNQDDYRQMVADLKRNGCMPEQVIHGWARDSFANQDRTVQAQLEQGIYSLFGLSRAFLEAQISHQIQLLFVYPFAPGTAQPLYEALDGFAGTLRQENPALIYKTVGIANLAERLQTEPARVLEWILSEFRPGAADVAVRYDGQSRTVRRLAETGPPAARPALLREGGVYLITGGSGGLGLIFAEYLAKRIPKARLVLSGRSELSPAFEAKLRRLETWGAEAVYIRADIARQAEVKELIAATRRRFETINGVIHSAGLVRDAFLIKKTRSELDAVLAPKVWGALYLDRALRPEKPDFWVMFSSMTAVMGNAGQSDYAFANSFLDHFARFRTAEPAGSYTLAINWPLWAEGGMKIREDWVEFARENAGIAPLGTEMGLAAFETGLNSGLTQFMVVAGDPGRIREQLAGRMNGRTRPVEAPPTAGGTIPSSALPEGDESGRLKAETENFLKTLLARETKLAPAKIRSREAFEKYGIDSLIIMNLNRELERHFGELSKTLLFEYENIEALAGYFIKNHSAVLRAKLGRAAPSGESIHSGALGNGDAAGTVRPRFRAGGPAPAQTAPAAEDEIVIIGVHGRYPMADTPDEFWENLKQGRDCITEVPADRWDYREYFDPVKGKVGKTYSKWGGFIRDADQFDPLFFNISPREAEFTDPQERVFLETVWQTIEDAGYTRERLSRYQVGVFVGAMYAHYQLYLSGDPDTQGVVPNSSFASIANRVSYFYNFNGPSIALDTMCSSSLTAIHLACESIRRGESELAVAGGVNLTVHPHKYILLAQGKFASTDGRCRSFGEGGDGYVPGEGVGAVLLKAKRQALADGDRIYAVIKGSALNHGGRTNGYTVPNPNAQAGVIAETLRKSGLDPRTISYIEAHGTGTALGDPIEITGLVKAFREFTQERQYCAIGSAKSNIGHLESAAGIAALTKVLLQFKYKQLAPSIHAERLNPNINLTNTPFYLQRTLTAWDKPVLTEHNRVAVYPRRAGVSSFGAGGSNAHVILEEYEAEAPAGSARTGEAQLIILSAKDEERLRESVQRLRRFLENSTPVAGPPAVAAACLPGKIRDDLVAAAAAILEVDPADIDSAESLEAGGFDLNRLAGLTRRINDHFGMELVTIGALREAGDLESLARTLLAREKAHLIAIYGLTAEPETDTAERTAEGAGLIDIAYTLQVGREAMEERLALVVSDQAELLAALNGFLERQAANGELYQGNIKTAGVNPGAMIEGEEGENYLRGLMVNRKLSKLAQLWVSGAVIDWRELYPGGAPRIISLPTYAFARERCWVPEATVAAPAGQPAQSGKAELGFHIFEKTWQEGLPLPADVKKEFGALIVIANPATLPLAEALRRADWIGEVLTIRYGDSDRRFTPEQARQIMRELLAEGKSIDGLVDLSDLDGDCGAQGGGSLAKIAMVQELIRASLTKPLRLLHLTRGLNPSQSCEPTLAGADMAGLVKMLGAEYQKISATTVDLDLAAAETAAVTALICRELALPDPENEVCYREGKRYLPSIRKLWSAPAGRDWSGTQSLLSDPEKPVVISGGTRGIGLEVARHLVKQGARKLVLMGVRELPPRSQWESRLSAPDTDPQLRARLAGIRDLENHGVEVEIYIGSLLEKEKLTGFFDRIRAGWGAIGGVIHCAGLTVNEHPSFINKTDSEMQAVFEPKIQGLSILHEIFQNDPLDFFTLFSSVSALAPSLGVGVSDYAAANSFMDYFAAYQHRKGNTYYQSLNWPNWKEAGMGEVATPMYRRLGLTAHSTEAGLFLFDQAAGFKTHPVVMPCLVDETRFTPAGLLTVKQESGLLSPPGTSRPTTATPPSGPAGPGNLHWLRELFSAELKIAPARLDNSTSFGDLGVDSILLAELVQKVERRIGSKLDPSILIEYATLQSLSGYLEDTYGRPSGSAAVEPDSSSVAVSDRLVNRRPDWRRGFKAKLRNLRIPMPAAGQSRSPAERQSNRFRKIAVIGMACNFPGAPDRETYWQNLAAGKSSIGEIPESRWDIRRYYSPEYQKGKSISKWGGFIANIEDFDPGYFQISEADAPGIDPLIRQFMEISVQTLADAGYTKEELWNRKVGVFVGARAGSFTLKLEQATKNSITGVGQNFIAAYVSHFLNFKGPNLVVDTACSSSLVSLHLACQSLILEESELALAGGVEILLDEKPYIVLSESRALSPDGKCRTFDEKANGFVPGEGCGAVLLKPLEKALRDGDRIYAVIDATAVNNDGHTMGVTTPNPEAQQAVIREALAKGGIHPGSIGYIETHGTGTMIGDPIELKALTKVFREFTAETGFSAVGSVKTNFGHLLSAAGIASFIKVVLALFHRQIPPTLHCEVPNPRFKFDSSPFYPVDRLQAWNPRHGGRRAGVSSFGFGGTNAHVLVSDLETGKIAQYEPKRRTLPAIRFNRKRFWLQREQAPGQTEANREEPAAPEAVAMLEILEEGLDQTAAGGELVPLLEIIAAE